MIIVVDESFKKDFKKLQGSTIQKRILEKIDDLEVLEDIQKMRNIKLLKGFPDFYRLRVGDYRVGFSCKNNIITLLRVRSRKDIYNVFP